MSTRDQGREEQTADSRAILGATELEDDRTAVAIIAFLQAEGGSDLSHAGGRSLLDHLVGTYAILRRWGQPLWLQHAALLHSVYGTDAYPQRLLSPARGIDVAAMAGDRVERLAYLFAVTPRRPLVAGTYRWTRDLPARAVDAGGAIDQGPPTRDELDALVLLHMANVAEQARASDGSPGRWLVRCRDLAELIVDSDSVTPPPFTAQIAELTEADESVTRQAYIEAVRDQREVRADGFALAAAVCPIVPEPCVWLAQLALGRGQAGTARSWASLARSRLLTLGTPWDGRLTFDEWHALIEALEQSPPAPRSVGPTTHPARSVSRDDAPERTRGVERPV